MNTQSSEKKSAAPKDKAPHPSLHEPRHPAAEPPWNGSRLPATFEWEFPARPYPSRRDEVSGKLSDEMDRLVVEALRGSYAMPGPGAPTPEMASFQKAIHEVYGKYLHHNLEANSVHVACGRGCSRCCHHFVTSVHALEVLCLYEALRARPDLEELMEACAKRVDDFEGWKDFCEETYPERTPEERDDLVLEHYYDEGNPCPFLAPDGACGAYEHRPVTCRMYLASSPRRYCEPELVTDDESDIFTIPVDESVALRLERLDRAVDYWGHSPDLFRSLARLHAWRRRWGSAGGDASAA